MVGLTPMNRRDILKSLALFWVFPTTSHALHTPVMPQVYELDGIIKAARKCASISLQGILDGMKIKEGDSDKHILISSSVIVSKNSARIAASYINEKINELVGRFEDEVYRFRRNIVFNSSLLSINDNKVYINSDRGMIVDCGAKYISKDKLKVTLSIVLGK